MDCCALEGHPNSLFTLYFCARLMHSSYSKCSGTEKEATLVRGRSVSGALLGWMLEIIKGMIARSYVGIYCVELFSTLYIYIYTLFWIYMLVCLGSPPCYNDRATFRLLSIGADVDAKTNLIWKRKTIRKFCVYRGAGIVERNRTKLLQGTY